MAELRVAEDERPGILKEIDEGAMDLIFQAIQEDIYSYPIKSFVRESISNGLDAIIERDIFKSIEAGDPVEKYFLQRDDGKLLKDSSYDPEYYDAKNLATHNKVYVTYKTQTPRDIIRITDHGVGLGGTRLKGFFKLGYSSKRNMKLVMGKFGAGAKAGLATGVEYFVMRTVYNGYATSFMIFKNDYEAITPESDATIVEEWKVKMSNHDIQTRNIYWEPTHEKNGVSIELEVKKHNKQAFINAVTEQFQYFNGRVQLKVYDEYGGEETNELDQEPDYESDNILIPKYSTYTSPHILVDGISYGLISWDELELERRTGKIAIKVHATDVDITQSRESLKWTERTKKTILAAVSKAKAEAEEYVTRFLTLNDPENIFELNNKYSAIGFNSGDNVAKVFGRFLDMHSIVPRYDFKFNDKSRQVYLSDTFFETFFYSFDFFKLSLYNGKIDKEKVTSFSDLQNSVIAFADKSHVGPKLMSHLLVKHDVDSIIYVRFNHTRIKSIVEYGNSTYAVEPLKKHVAQLLAKHSTVFVDDYEVQYDEDEKSMETDKVVTPSNVLAMQRRMNKEVLYTHYKDTALDEDWGHKVYFAVNQYRKTIRIAELKSHFESKEVVICTGKYKALGRMVEIAAQVFPDSNLQVIYVAQDVVHHFAPYGTVITDYLRQVDIKTGELMIGEQIRNLNTWRMALEICAKYKYSNYYNMMKAITTIDVSKLENIRGNSKDFELQRVLTESGTIKDKALDDVMGYLDSLKDFQKVVRSLDKEKIASKALELFNSDEIYHIDAYDEEFISTLESELERLRPIEDLIDCIYRDTGFYEFEKAEPLFNLLLTSIEHQK